MIQSEPCVALTIEELKLAGLATLSEGEIIKDGEIITVEVPYNDYKDYYNWVSPNWVLKEAAIADIQTKLYTEVKELRETTMYNGINFIRDGVDTGCLIKGDTQAISDLGLIYNSFVNGSTSETWTYSNRKEETFTSLEDFAVLYKFAAKFRSKCISTRAKVERIIELIDSMEDIVEFNLE